MAKYVKKPETIEALEFGKEEIPDSVKLTHWYGIDRVWNDLHGEWIPLKKGDMIRIDKAPRDAYPIDKETFKESYRAPDANNRKI